MTKILIDRKLVEQALEALETCDAAHISDGGRQWYDDKAVEEAITALKAALAEPNRAQKMRDAGYTRRPTLREMAEPQEPVQTVALWGLSGNGYSPVFLEQAEPPEPLTVEEALAKGWRRFYSSPPKQAEPVAHFGSAYVNENGVHITTVLGPVAIPQDAKIYIAPPQRPAEPEPPLGQASTDVGVPVYVVKKAEPQEPCNKSCAPGYCYCEPVQEPVAWHYTNNGGGNVMHWCPSARLDADIQAAKDYPRVHKVTPLYATPPQRKPLSGIQVERLLEQVIGSLPVARNLIRAVEAAHGIKEGT